VARLLQEVLADGISTSTYLRDAAGQVTVAVDPRGVATSYTYVYGPYNPTLYGGAGDLIQTNYADGSFDAYQYDPTFHHVTQKADALGVTETDTYDPGTGDLVTSADAVGNTTTYAWSNGLLMSETTPHLAGTPAGGSVYYATTTNVYDAFRRLTVHFDEMGGNGKGVGSLCSKADADAHTTPGQNGICGKRRSLELYELALLRGRDRRALSRTGGQTAARRPIATSAILR
jgi:hypothetical protein